jgi:hypothetical protein
MPFFFGNDTNLPGFTQGVWASFQIIKQLLCHPPGLSILACQPGKLGPSKVKEFHVLPPLAVIEHNY